MTTEDIMMDLMDLIDNGVKTERESARGLALDPMLGAASTVGLNVFNGLTVSTSLYVPEFRAKRQLSTNLDVSDEFRSEFNTWLMEFFGGERVMYKMNGGLIMHPGTKKFLELQIRSPYEES